MVIKNSDDTKSELKIEAKKEIIEILKSLREITNKLQSVVNNSQSKYFDRLNIKDSIGTCNPDGVFFWTKLLWQPEKKQNPRVNQKPRSKIIL